MDALLRSTSALYDTLQARWRSPRLERAMGTLLVVAFVGALLVIEARRQGWLTEPVATLVPTNHFYAVQLAFTLLLLMEVIALVFSLAESVSNSVGMQFEIFSLILLRQAFEEFTHFTEPVEWVQVRESVVHMGSDAVGALAVFVALGLYYRLQRHQPIATMDMRGSFVAGKKLIALLLLATFVAIGLHDLRCFFLGLGTYPFFEAFYTILIFSDVLIVLISLRYSATYRVVFRNSGFAVATVFVRLALTAPPITNALLGLLSVLFACGLTSAYNGFAGGPRSHIGEVAGSSPPIDTNDLDSRDGEAYR